MFLFKRVLLFLQMTALALTLISCAGTSVKPIIAERPKDEAFRSQLNKEASSLNIPIEATTADITKILNQVVGKEIYKGSTKYKGVTVDILRNEPIAVSAADNYIFLTMPISMSLNYGMFGTPALSFKLKFKMNAKITPDWNVNAEIYYMGLSDLFAEEIGIGPLSIKPRGVMEGITMPVQKFLSDVISKKINEKYPLKTQIAKAWNAAQKPILLDKNYKAWLKLTPLEVMLYPLYAQNNQVKLSLGLKTFAELVVGPEPAMQPLLALTDLKLVNTIDKNFRITLNSDLFYKEIVTIASPLLLNKELGSKEKSIIIKNLDIYGSGDKLIIKVETSGSFEGAFYLTGKPLFNPQTNIFSVEELDFDMSTQDLLLKSANWLLHGTIKSKIQEKLNMDLTPKLEESRLMAQKAMDHVKLIDHIFLKGSIKTIKLSDMMVQKDKISIQVYTEGETAIIFQ